jgi:hypothetical protein
MSSIQHRRLRAPTEDGAALIDPPLDQAPGLIEANCAVADQFVRGSGFSSAFRDQARSALVDPPRILVQSVTKLDPKRTIIATGHQPELFHPGVWFKNFIADAIARKVNGWAMNFIVDNDLARSSGIRVPTRVNDSIQISEAQFDVPAAATPWETRSIVDPQIFKRFGREVRQLFGPMMRSSQFKAGIILDQLWPHAIDAFKRQDHDFREFATGLSQLADDIDPNAFPPFGMLSSCLAEARSRVEADLGLTVSDRPLSEVSEQRPFLEFTRILLSSYRDLYAIHNAALAEYRIANHVRSQSHPVPELASDGDWLEVPLWIWSYQDSRNRQRKRVFVRSSGDGIQLTDRGQTVVSLPVNDSSEYWSILTSHGIKLRPRALITTMYARLVLSDLFIHGIGGAKYDELTDLIIRRFFGIEPPGYITATATFRLPIERPNVSLEDVRASSHLIRDLRYRPESFMRDPRVTQDSDLSKKLAALAAEKRDFLDQHDLRNCSQDVFDRLNLLNLAMNDLLTPLEQPLRAEHRELMAQAKQSQLLGSREFSFVLFPSEILPARLLDLCKNIS